jgi:hypothetical protein
VQALCRLCAASSRPIFVILPIGRRKQLNLLFSARSQLLLQRSRWVEFASLYGQEILGGVESRDSKEATGCRGSLWEKLEMARSACGAHVFPGGEDASVEFFVQVQN